MADNKLTGYKKLFGFVLPLWVDEKLIKIFVSLLLGAVAMVFVLLFVIWPKFDQIKNAKSQLDANMASLSSLKNSKAGIDKLGADITKTQQDNILNSIPLYYSPENAIFMLRKLSSETGVSIVSYRLPPGVLLETNAPTGTGGKSDEMISFVKFPIRIQVTAQVSSILNFISKIETSIPFGVVSDLNVQEVTKLSKSLSANTVQTELEVIYFQSKMNKVSIDKVTPFTKADLDLAKQLEGYSTGVAVADTSVLQPLIGTPSGGLFGF